MRGQPTEITRRNKDLAGLIREMNARGVEVELVTDEGKVIDVDAARLDRDGEVQPQLPPGRTSH